MSNIAIIGAGIAGLLPAYYLAQEGHNVSVYEQESYPAMRTSYANGGQVSVSNSEVWNSWSNVLKGIKWMLKKDAPLLVRPNLDWDKAIWLTKFLYHTAQNDRVKRTIETIRLGMESRKLYQEIIAKENIEFNQRDCGILHIYKDQKYFEQAQLLREMYESNGCEWQTVDRKQVLNIEPRLESSPRIIGGIWTPSDWTGDIHKFCYNLSRILEFKYSVKFFYNHHVDNIYKLHQDIIIIANGIGSIKLAKNFGDKLPIYPVKGYSVTIPAIDIKSFESMPTVSLLDDQAKIVTSKLGDNLRVAGTAELAGENYDIRRDRIDPLLKWVKVNFPKVDRRIYTQWACLRPMTPNMMPIVGPSKCPNVYYHVGHGHLGWTLSPATAKMLVDIIDKK